MTNQQLVQKMVSNPFTVKNCTATKDSEVIQALDHNLEKKIEKEEATCTEGRLRRILELYELPEAFRR